MSIEQTILTLVNSKKIQIQSENQNFYQNLNDPKRFISGLDQLKKIQDNNQELANHANKLTQNKKKLKEQEKKKEEEKQKKEEEYQKQI